MARVTVTAFTAARMLAIENSTVTSGRITNGILELMTRDGTAIQAGSVLGPKGDRGEAGGVWDATSTLKGALKLAGNIGGSADVPKVTGALDGTVDTSLAFASTPWTHPFTGAASTVSATLRQILATVSTVNVIAASTTIAKGRTKVLWSGSESEYLALPLAERNDPGFVGVVV